jgi:ribosomal protein S12 methylthiotransferase
MATQETVSTLRLQRKVGATLTVLIDKLDADFATGRSSADAPDIDGVVQVAPHASLEAGEFARVKITASDTHDLKGTVA